jgi:hypothetical protein
MTTLEGDRSAACPLGRPDSGSKPSGGGGTAKRRRLQRERADARHVLWLISLLQAKQSHHTANSGRSESGELFSLESEAASVAAKLSSFKSGGAAGLGVPNDAGNGSRGLHDDVCIGTAADAAAEPGHCKADIGDERSEPTVGEKADVSMGCALAFSAAAIPLGPIAARGEALANHLEVGGGLPSDTIMQEGTVPTPEHALTYPEIFESAPGDCHFEHAVGQSILGESVAQNVPNEGLAEVSQVCTREYAAAVLPLGPTLQEDLASANAAALARVLQPALAAEMPREVHADGRAVVISDLPPSRDVEAELQLLLGSYGAVESFSYGHGWRDALAVFADCNAALAAVCVLHDTYRLEGCRRTILLRRVDGDGAWHWLHDQPYSRGRKR